MATDAFSSIGASSNSRPWPLVFILILFVVVVLALAAWYFFFWNKSSDAPVVETGNEPAISSTVPLAGSGDANLDQEAQDILDAIAILKTINLDTKFFDDPRFNALRETPVEVKLIFPSEEHPFDLFPATSVLPPPPPPGRRR